MRLTLLTIVLLIAWPSAATTWTTEEIAAYARGFARERTLEGHALLFGPSVPSVPDLSAPRPSCADLYARRLTLTRAQLDYRPPLSDDPRLGAAALMGTMWTPAFYYIPYRAVTRVLDPLRDHAPRAELAMLQHASAQHQCFVR